MTEQGASRVSTTAAAEGERQRRVFEAAQKLISKFVKMTIKTSSKQRGMRCDSHSTRRSPADQLSLLQNEEFVLCLISAAAGREKRKLGGGGGRVERVCHALPRICSVTDPFDLSAVRSNTSSSAAALGAACSSSASDASALDVDAAALLLLPAASFSFFARFASFLARLAAASSSESAAASAAGASCCCSASAAALRLAAFFSFFAALSCQHTVARE